MGLTIHYRIEASKAWLAETIKAKLEEARRYALTLPVQSVTDLVEFDGRDCDFQSIRDRGLEDQDAYFWGKIQGQKHFDNPWLPGCYGSQPASHMIVFSVLPAKGCEQMNIGSSTYGDFVWPKAKEISTPAWSLALDKPQHHQASYTLLRGILRRWKLRRVPSTSTMLMGEKIVFTVTADCRRIAEARIQKGRYLSHRKGYGPSFGLVTLADRFTGTLHFRFRGSAEEAEQVFSSPEFQAELRALVTGKDHVIPATTGTWSSFCKTQYANDPRLGGTKNFLTAHLSVLAILEHLKSLGFSVKVEDEGGFWEKRELGELQKWLAEYDVAVAGLAGAMRDAAGKQRMEVETAFDGRQDFEHLEAKAQNQFAGLLRQIRSVPTPEVRHE